MSTVPPNPVVDELRQRIQPVHDRNVLPFGIETIDRVLPGGGLTLGALHEVAGGGSGAIDGAAAALFTAGIGARTKGKVLWCVVRQDLVAPALAQAGLLSGRVIYVEAGDNKALLACFEEGPRHGGLGAVVAEVAGLSMTASRRLYLAAETSGAIGIAIRRWRRLAALSNRGCWNSRPKASTSTAAATRNTWRARGMRRRPAELRRKWARLHKKSSVRVQQSIGCIDDIQRRAGLLVARSIVH
jgi:protein ImuA